MDEPFGEIDRELRAWAADKQLHPSTEYTDEEVRSFEIVGQSGSRCQIWVEIDQVPVVHVWDYKQRRETFRGEGLSELLDAALGRAKGWNESAL